MKRFLALFLSIILLTVYVSSCSSSFEYEIFETGVYYSFSDSEHNVNKDISRVSERTEKAGVPDRDVVYNGKTHHVEYDCSYTCSWAESADRYESYYPYKYFVFDSSNGELINFFIGFDISSPPDNVSTKSREECVTVAYDFLSEYIDDPEEYEITWEMLRETDRRVKYYEWDLSRIIDGVQTSDRLRISVTDYGEIIGYKLDYLGEMKEAKLPTESQMQEIHEGLHQRLDEMYAGVKEVYSVSYAIEETTYVLLPDGRYAFDYYVVATLTPLDGSTPDRFSNEERMQFLVVIN